MIESNVEAIAMGSCVDAGAEPAGCERGAFRLGLEEGETQRLIPAAVLFTFEEGAGQLLTGVHDDEFSPVSAPRSGGCGRGQRAMVMPMSPRRGYLREARPRALGDRPRTAVRGCVRSRTEGVCRCRRSASTRVTSGSLVVAHDHPPRS